MKGVWKDYFHFQKVERRGIFVLIALIVLVVVLINVLNIERANKTKDFSAFEKKIAAFEAKMKETADNNNNNNQQQENPTDERTQRLFVFDPNNLPIEKWMQLGLTKDQAEVIKNYETKGGTFYDKEDVKKMYSISDEMYEKLKNYIQIKKVFPENTNRTFQYKSSKKYTEYKPKKEISYLDLNIVDSASLVALKGIGPAFSSRIIKYRKLLGGFIRKKQLLEVWGLDSVVYAKVSPSLFIGKNTEIKKININRASAEDMKEHPYISWQVANSIEKFREQNGSYLKVEDIMQSHLIDDSLYRKIAPYLSVD